MGNMSYCRFENTSRDLQDCLSAIYNGETVVLGGLLTNSRIKVEDSTPVLSKLPLIGRFFTSEAETSIKDAYIILVTVRLENPAGEPVSR